MRQWKTVQKVMREWARADVWNDRLRMLYIKADHEAIIIDATIIKLQQHGTGAKGGTSTRRSGAVKED